MVIFEVAALGTSLFGRRRGEHDAPSWQAQVPANISSPTPWIIDFATVDATYSYLDATLGELLSTCASGRYPDVLPVARNLKDDTLEELLASLHLRNAALWIQKGKDWRVAGPLDPSLKEALINVGTNEGKGSKELLPKGAITQAGWANRLTQLMHLRLVMRTRVGKTFHYKATPRVIEPECVLELSNTLFLRSAHGLSR
jgi:hypothetical protein